MHMFFYFSLVTFSLGSFVVYSSNDIEDDVHLFFLSFLSVLIKYELEKDVSTHCPLTCLFSAVTWRMITALIDGLSMRWAWDSIIRNQ